MTDAGGNGMSIDWRSNFARPRLSKATECGVGDPQHRKAFFSGSRSGTDAEQALCPRLIPQANQTRFSYIHFVAHGTASRLSPLDSAVMLSAPTGHPDTFKLYAREIVQKPLHARLVTISTCYGSGLRAYAGEGLVGLSWAFLRAVRT